MCSLCAERIDDVPNVQLMCNTYYIIADVQRNSTSDTKKQSISDYNASFEESVLNVNITSFTWNVTDTQINLQHLTLCIGAMKAGTGSLIHVLKQSSPNKLQKEQRIVPSLQ